MRAGFEALAVCENNVSLLLFVLQKPPVEDG